MYTFFVVVHVVMNWYPTASYLIFGTTIGSCILLLWFPSRYADYVPRVKHKMIPLKKAKGAASKRKKKKKNRRWQRRRKYNSRAAGLKSPPDPFFQTDILDEYFPTPSDSYPLDLYDEFECMTAIKEPGKQEARFDTDSFDIAIDNCCSRCITNNKDDFITDLTLID